MFKQVGECKPGTTKFTSKNCKPEESYTFRIKAVNEQGESEPAVSAPVTCASKLSKFVHCAFCFFLCEKNISLFYEICFKYITMNIKESFVFNLQLSNSFIQFCSKS